MYCSKWNVIQSLKHVLNCHPEQHLLLRHYAHLAPDLDDPDLPQDRLLGLHLQVLPRQEHHQHADPRRPPHRPQRRRDKPAHNHLQGRRMFFLILLLLNCPT